jgi:hypothetical protein
MLTVMRHHAPVSIDENVFPSLVQKSFVGQQPQLFVNFIYSAFPTLYFHNQFRSGEDPDFTDTVRERFGSHAFLDATVCCLSTVYFGYLTGDVMVQRASRQMYSNALRQVNRALDTDMALSDEMLCTLMMLTIYEMYARTSEDAWMRHASGAKHLFLSRGVKAHMSGFGRSCYIAFRGFLIAHALSEGQPCFLDEDEWQDLAAIVREEDSKKPGEFSIFVDIGEVVFMELAKCPRYLHDAREVSSATRREERASLMDRIRSTCSKLQALTDDLRSSIAAHSQRKQGIVMRPGSFVGPVPEVFPVTSPSLLLLGATSAVATLQKLSWMTGVDAGPVEFESPLPALEETSSPTPSAAAGSSEMPSSLSSSKTSSSASVRSFSPRPQTISLPFRLVSEASRGPARTTDNNDPEAVTWPDRIGSSMGMLGAEIVYEDEEPNPDAVVEEVKD